MTTTKTTKRTWRRDEIATHVYVWTHGHAPRGRGYWAFEMTTHDYMKGVPPKREVVFAPGERLYSDAKAWAMDYASTHGVHNIAVCS
jgi:hypothetical protein